MYGIFDTNENLITTTSNEIIAKKIINKFFNGQKTNLLEIDNLDYLSYKNVYTIVFNKTTDHPHDISSVICHRNFEDAHDIINTKLNKIRQIDDKICISILCSSISAAVKHAKNIYRDNCMLIKKTKPTAHCKKTYQITFDNFTDEIIDVTEIESIREYYPTILNRYTSFLESGEDIETAISLAGKSYRDSKSYDTEKGC